MKQGSLTLIHSPRPIRPSGVRVPNASGVAKSAASKPSANALIANPARQRANSVSTILQQMNAEVDMRSNHYKTKCLEKLVLLSLLLLWMLFALL
jgi:hypothetical protein